MFYAIVFGSLLTGNLSGQENRPDKPASTENRTAVAIVNDYPITRQAAIRMLKHAVPNALNSSVPSPSTTLDQESSLLPSNDDSFSNQLVELAVDRLIAQRIVFDYLETNQAKISSSEIELELDQLKSDLDRIGQSIDQFLEKAGINQAELEFEIAWKLSWNRFLTSMLTEDFLERHYLSNQRQFDDSEMRVAHLLIRMADFKSADEAIAAAVVIRERLNPNSDRPDRLTWGQAVSKFSKAPTRDDNGEIGWIRFHEPMPAMFSTAAFQLQQGEISPPVVTPFGVHLIKCLELKEGKTTWRDALEDVRRDAALRLFENLHQQHRPQVKIVIVDEG